MNIPLTILSLLNLIKVVYQAKDMLFKNRDLLSKSLADLVAKSKSGLILSLYKNHSAHLNSVSSFYMVSNETCTRTFLKRKFNGSISETNERFGKGARGSRIKLRQVRQA